MIYTITLNPALDYTIKVNSIQLGSTNRTSEERLYAGGKGINVSAILKELDVDSCALGFTADFTGQKLTDMLFSQGIHTNFIHVQKGMTRINVKIKSDNESEINGKGPIIEESDFVQLLQKCSQLKDDDFLVLSGSIPSCMMDDTYERIIQAVSQKNIHVVVDAEKKLLLNTLKYHPFLIKPNRHELEQIFNIECLTHEDILCGAKKLQKMGAKNVLVSMDKDGSLLLSETGNVITMTAAKGTLVNSVGAGDSMIAGFIAGWINSHDYQDAILLASACGSATAFSEGLADKDAIMNVYQQLNSNQTFTQEDK